MRALRFRHIGVLLLVACTAVAGTWWYCERKHEPETSSESTVNQQVSSLPPPSSDRLATDRQAFEKAADYAQKITDSVLLIFGGSIAVLLGTGYRRPVKKGMRATYLLFPVGWVFLGLSIWEGMKVRGTYIAYLLGPPKSEIARTHRIEQLNGFARWQERWLDIGLAIFAIWLMFYLLWWIRLSDAEVEKGNAA